MGTEFRFCLYVAGDSPRSCEALANLTALCEAHLSNRYKIEIIDVLVNPRSALDHGIMLTPTVIKISPAPVRRIVGTLSRSEPLFRVFGLPGPV